MTEQNKDAIAIEDLERLVTEDGSADLGGDERRKGIVGQHRRHDGVHVVDTSLSISLTLCCSQSATAAGRVKELSLTYPKRCLHAQKTTLPMCDLSLTARHIDELRGTRRAS